MKALRQLQSDPTVDQIIQRVLIRNKNKHFDYIKKNPQNTTSQQQIWHLELQSQNQKLSLKLKQLKQKYQKKQSLILKNNKLKKQIQKIKLQLEETLFNNTSLQDSINIFRLKNQSIQESISQSFQQSRKKKKTLFKKQEDSYDNKKYKSTKRQKTKSIIDSSPSPVKSIIKQHRDVAIMCCLQQSLNTERDVEAKRKNIFNMKKLIQSQKKIIQSYEKQQIRQITKNESHNNIKIQNYTLSSNKVLNNVGSIIKIKRI